MLRVPAVPASGPVPAASALALRVGRAALPGSVPALGPLALPPASPLQRVAVAMGRRAWMEL
ncbi:MAG TPA: hypothetical protein VFS60_05930, partial [Thermoanaerobaculia bacterium]|nr:hypothetical protein [Thermoanaerobaculia bacterium]